MDDVHKSFAGKKIVMDCMAFIVKCNSIKKLDAVFDKMMRVLVTLCEHEARRFQEELFGKAEKNKGSANPT